MIHSTYKTRLKNLPKQKSFNCKKHIKTITQSQTQPLMIIGAQSIRKEEFMFLNYEENKNPYITGQGINESFEFPEAEPFLHHSFQHVKEEYILRSKGNANDCENKSFQENVMEKLSEMMQEMKEMKHEIFILKDLVKKSENGSIPRSSLTQLNLHEGTSSDSIANSPEDQSIFPLELSLELPVELPLSNEIDLQLIIEWIKQEMSNENLLALALITDGTFADAADKIRTTLRKLMTKQVAMLFNWEGRNRVNGPKKSSFLKTGLWKSVFMAVNHDEEVDELQATEVAKQWFKGANAKPKH